MARLDTARRRVHLSNSELAIATLLAMNADHAELADPEAPSHVAALEEAGALIDGRLVNWVDELVTVVAAPQLRILIETFVADEVVGHHAWATPSHGVLGTPEIEGGRWLSPIEPLLLPWAIARAVGLGRRPPSPVEGPLMLPASLLSNAHDWLASGNRERAEEVLRAVAGLTDTDRRAILDLCWWRRISWRATSLWASGEHEREVRTLTVVDGGDAGLWLSSLDDERASDPVVTLDPVRPSQVWQEILRLLPPAVPAGSGAPRS